MTGSTGPRWGLTRRQFVQLAGATAGAALVGPGALLRGARPAYAEPVPGGTLDPGGIAKYVTQLVVPPAMPRTSKIIRPGRKPVDYYEIAVRQFQQQILPPGMPLTTVWSYGAVRSPASLNYPAFTVEAKWEAPVRVKWINDLKDARGDYLPHLLTVDPTLHWANPPGGVDGRDMRPAFTSTPGPYTGPVPIVTHLHGGHSREESDGYAEAWYLPAANNIPSDYATVGSFYDEFKSKFEAGFTQRWDPGTAVFQYDNDQPAATNWYHDHTLGMTRLNVYAGPAGFYLLRGGPNDLPSGILPGPAPALGDSAGTRYYEVPLAIQDRSFNTDGSLFYPASREFFDGFTGPYVGDSDISPIWNPEYFGNTMLVNGRSWPNLQVEPRRYRFRLLNGCNGRFLILTLVTGDPTSRPATPALPFWQIGAEGGFLPAPVQLPQLLMSPAERADVIVDFTGLPVGTQVYLVNDGPDEPFNGEPGSVADPATTGQVMRFTVVPRVGRDPSVPPAQLTLPAPPPVGPATTTRQVSLNEADSEVLPDVGPREALLGTLSPGGAGNPLPWMAPVTENPAHNSIEIWEIYNFTADAHPIHIHEVQFNVVNRQPIAGGPARPPEPWETGRKDTVIAYPGEITRVRALFDLAGLYVWHCHIVEHEDNEMMRPYRIGP
jgi:FtsP/CotA-like multicopper oxidase with cupredoxin domain